MDIHSHYGGMGCGYFRLCVPLLYRGNFILIGFVCAGKKRKRKKNEVDDRYISIGKYMYNADY